MLASLGPSPRGRAPRRPCPFYSHAGGCTFPSCFWVLVHRSSPASGCREVHSRSLSTCLGSLCVLKCCWQLGVSPRAAQSHASSSLLLCQLREPHLLQSLSFLPDPRRSRLYCKAAVPMPRLRPGVLLFRPPLRALAAWRTSALRPVSHQLFCLWGSVLACWFSPETSATSLSASQKKTSWYLMHEPGRPTSPCCGGLLSTVTVCLSGALCFRNAGLRQLRLLT